jgi:hypothetical protein
MSQKDTPLRDRAELDAALAAALQATPVTDIHTHLYPPNFGSLFKSGIDDLLTYHYLVAEFFRAAHGEVSPEQFWTLPQPQQADLVWEHLFLRRSPISEAARGVITCLKEVGLDPNGRDLAEHRNAFAKWTPAERIDRVLQSSGVRSLVMTNDPFDETESATWDAGVTRDDCFHAALRLDPLFDASASAATHRQRLGLVTGSGNLDPDAARRFVESWCDRINPVYLAVSLPPDFMYPGTPAAHAIDNVLVPAARERHLPIALMIGVKRQVNPTLQLAGDAVGQADLTSLENLCRQHAQVRFLVTVLARENQHELVVLARKFANLHLFGCWWFLNIPHLTEEMTRMRIELLGHSFTPQHSDARVLEQLIYKWYDTRQMLHRVLLDKYAALHDAGWYVTASQVQTEVTSLLGGAAWRFCRPDA